MENEAPGRFTIQMKMSSDIWTWKSKVEESKCRKMKRSYLLTCVQGDSKDWAVFKELYFSLAFICFFKWPRLRRSFNTHVKIDLGFNYMKYCVTRNVTSPKMHVICKRKRKFEDAYFTICKHPKHSVTVGLSFYIIFKYRHKFAAVYSAPSECVCVRLQICKVRK